MSLCVDGVAFWEYQRAQIVGMLHHQLGTTKERVQDEIQQRKAAEQIIQNERQVQVLTRCLALLCCFMYHVTVKLKLKLRAISQK
jgi:hypothetical protein